MPIIISGVNDQNYANASDLVLVWRESRINVDENNNILNKDEFPVFIVRRLLTPPSAKTQIFYALRKTHKKVLKIRPIVSGMGASLNSWAGYCNTS